MGSTRKRALPGFALLIGASVGVAAFALAVDAALNESIWSSVIPGGFLLVVVLARFVLHRLGHTAVALSRFCSRPVLSVVIPAYVILAASSLVTHFGGPEIVGHLLRNPPRSGLEFAYRGCREGSDLKGSTEAPTIMWERANIARVSAIAESNCGTSWLFGDYAVNGNTLTLEYQAVVRKYYLCDCGYRVTYRIRDLPRRDYAIRLYAQPEIYSRLWLWKLLRVVGD